MPQAASSARSSPPPLKLLRLRALCWRRATCNSTQLRGDSTQLAQQHSAPATALSTRNTLSSAQYSAHAQITQLLR